MQTFIPAFTRRPVAIVVQAILAIILLLFGGNFRQFFSLAIFAEWLFYMIASSTVFVFRRREPDASRPYRVWGYPVVPALFVLASTVLLYYTFTGNLRLFGIRVSGHSRRRTGFLHFCVAANAERLKVALANLFFQTSSILALPRLLKDTPAGHVYPSLCPVT